MFLNHIFLLTDFYNNDFIPDAAQPCSVIIPIDKALWENKRHYLQKLGSSSFQFCFALLNSGQKLSKGDLDDVRDSLSTFFFLPNYIKKASTYVLVSNVEAGKNQVSLSDIEKTLATQGIAPLSKNYAFEYSKDINELSEHCFFSHGLNETIGSNMDAGNFQTIFKQILTANAIKKHWIISVKDEQDFEIKKSNISKFKTWVAENESSYLDLLLEFEQMNNEFLRLETENKKLKFRIDNYNDYLKLLRETAVWHVEEYHRIHNEKQWVVQQYSTANTGQAVTNNASSSNLNANTNTSSVIYTSNEVQNELEFLKANRDNILNWYMKEYESLPLWYKRLGHVIKVMLGKRSIKSLYH